MGVIVYYLSDNRVITTIWIVFCDVYYLPYEVVGK